MESKRGRHVGDPEERYDVINNALALLSFMDTADDAIDREQQYCRALLAAFTVYEKGMDGFAEAATYVPELAKLAER